MMPGDIFDLLLAIALPVLALSIVKSDDLHVAVVMFVALGLLSALAWGRLGAPDIALVEAAVGAGITGALLMHAIDARRLRSAKSSRRPHLLFAVPLAAIAAAMAIALATLPESEGQRAAVMDNLERAGAKNPVTAVLLAFRAWDTLLEVFVLVVASLAAARMQRLRANEEPPDARLDTLARVLTPAGLVISGALLWKGKDAPGGAFQAAAILTGVGVLLLLARKISAPRWSLRFVRLGVLFGPALFVLAAVAPLAFGLRLLEIPPPFATASILVIEAALTISIALVLLTFFPNRAGEDER